MTALIQPVDPHVQMAYVECHGDGHQWHHGGFVGAPDWSPPFGLVGAIARHSVCTNCGTERARWYTRSGEVLNRYRHPDGYLHKRQTPDDAAPSRLEWRRTLAVELFDRFDREQQPATRRARKRAS